MRSDAYGSIFLTDGDRPNYPMHNHTHLAPTYDISLSLSKDYCLLDTQFNPPMHTLFILSVCKRKNRIKGSICAGCRSLLAKCRLLAVLSSFFFLPTGPHVVLTLSTNILVHVSIYKPLFYILVSHVGLILINY